MDQIASNDYGVPAMVLMERAGIAVFEAIKEMLPCPGRISVLCGRGNNGGDGFVVARLAHEAGYDVEVLVAASESQLRDDARTQLAVSRAQGVQPTFYDDPCWSRRLECIAAFDLVVDALLGTGAHGEIKGPIAEAIQAINHSGIPAISVDIPSGIETDTGSDLGASVWALRTITFGVPKPFLFQGIGMEHAGYWTVADIGYPSAVLQSATDARLIDLEWVADVLPTRMRTAHKRDNGHVLIIAGSHTMPGAAALACRGALRAGAGLVTLASVESVCDLVSAQLPEVIRVPLPNTNGFLNKEAALALRDIRADSAVIGPGLGQAEPVREFLADLFRDWEIPSCLDADALNAISSGVPLPQTRCVLTPHPGEMGRLMGSSVGEIQSDRFRTVTEATAKFGQAVVLKGPHTIIGCQGKPMSVNPTGNCGMASAGMGDVLSGLIGTLLAQDLPTYCGAMAAVYWHGLAADICQEVIGQVGYLASDVADSLPAARAKLTSSCEARSRVRSSLCSCPPLVS
ncbi:MAG: NAD(P)H-hydrate dehydratase [Fimbriimonadaceae bacterium]|nr:NAD(P)H-hydrate dehydratase [Fimbriimonadaceae bacterium]